MTRRPLTLLAFLSAFSLPPSAFLAADPPAKKAGPAAPSAGKIYKMSTEEVRSLAKARAERLQKKLDETKPALGTKETSFAKMLDLVGKTWGVRIIGDWEAIAQIAEVESDDPLEFAQPDADSLRAVLTGVCSTFSGKIKDDGLHVTWVADLPAGAVRVSTKRALAGKAEGVIPFRENEPVNLTVAEKWSRENLVERLDLPGVSLRKALEFTAATFGVKLQADWKALAAAGINPDKAAVNLSLKEVSLFDAATAILEAAEVPKTGSRLLIGDDKSLILTAPPKADRKVK
jgi:hypothetical protein